MKIIKLTAENFKSFKKVECSLSDFTLIVGANAAGKSNLISLFKFIKDIAAEGLDNAIALQGGIDKLVNASQEKGTPITISFLLKIEEDIWWHGVKKEYDFRPRDLYYKFTITPNKKGLNYNVSYDELTLQYDIGKLTKGSPRNNCEVMDGLTCSSRWIKASATSKYNYEEHLPDEIKGKENKYLFVSPFDLKFMYHAHNGLLLSDNNFLLPPFIFREQFITIFDFDPKKLKQPCLISSRKNLEADGSNLAAVLRQILKSKEQYNKFVKLLKNALPFVQKVEIERTYDQSCAYKLIESYSKKSFYSLFLSDGTVSIIAIIIALYFDSQSKVIIIEEPERNLHPRLLGSVVQMASDVSSKKQVIFTTHNPEILTNADIGNIRFIQRNSEGYSVVSEPSNNEKVKQFIDNELSIGELFISNLLGD